MQKNRNGIEKEGWKRKNEGIPNLIFETVFLFDFLNCIFKNQSFNAEFKNIFF